MKWLYIEEGPATAAANMQRDAELLQSAASLEGPLLRGYTWLAPSLTYGYFCQPERWLLMGRLEQLGWEWARRPTGGGITFHDNDMAFSIVLPANHIAYSLSPRDSYTFINGAVAKALTRYSADMLKPSLNSQGPSFSKHSIQANFCMAGPTQYDVTVNGLKLVGAAQRRLRNGLLHQGTITLTAADLSFIESIINKESTILDDMRQHNHALLTKAPSQREKEVIRREIMSLIHQECQEAS